MTEHEKDGAAVRECECSGDETGRTVTGCHFHRVVRERNEWRDKHETLRAEVAALREALEQIVSLNWRNESNRIAKEALRRAGGSE